MQSRRPVVSPLAIVLPHPPLPRRRSSLFSDSSLSGYRTPPNAQSPTCSAVFFTPSRKSTDSWNSSNADELEWEWKPEQVLLLSRTLDALPAHLVTPFNGPIPPPNLLDKIARGVSQAKGPTDWPHSIRATRVKLIELARSKAKEEALANHRRQAIAEEPEVEIDDGSSCNYPHDPAEPPLTTTGARRPIYRQSSMDFIDEAGTDLKDNPNIARLSRRLQRANPTFHPYARASRANPTRRSTSPPPLANMPSLISPSSESSDTLNTFSSFSSDIQDKRRSLSSLSSISMLSGSSGGAVPQLPDPRVQRIRRSEPVSVVGPPKQASDHLTSSVGYKRAPAYGALAQDSRRESGLTQGRHVRRDSGSYPSSDEEEKARTMHAKKPRIKSLTKSASPITTSSTLQRPSSPLPPPVPEKDRKHIKGRKTPSTPVQDENVKSPPASPAKLAKNKSRAELGAASGERPSGLKRPAPMNLQRNPSMFGPELPQPPVDKLSPAPMSPTKLRNVVPLSPTKLQGGVSTPTRVLSPHGSPMVTPGSLRSPATPPPTSPPVTKTLRRVRRLVPSRRISFGSLLSGGDEGERGEGSCLGGAFQLL